MVWYLVESELPPSCRLWAGPGVCKTGLHFSGPWLSWEWSGAFRLKASMLGEVVNVAGGLVLTAFYYNFTAFEAGETA